MTTSRPDPSPALSRTPFGLLAPSQKAECLRIFVSSFPQDERPSLRTMAARLGHASYHAAALTRGGEVVGIIGSWHTHGLRYIEHYALSPTARGGGLGSLFLSAFLAESPTPTLIEVELPTTPVQHRRISFYQRLGFHILPLDYAQPPYRKGFPRIPMHIMVCPPTAAAFEIFAKELMPVVYGCAD